MLQKCTCAVLILQLFERSFTVASRHPQVSTVLWGEEEAFSPFFGDGSDVKPKVPLSQTNKHPYQIFSITVSLHRKQGLAINGFTTRGYNRKRGHIKGNGFFVWVGWGGCVSERRSEKTAFVFTSPKFQNRPPLSSPYSSSCRLFCIFAFLIPLPSTCIDSSPLYVHWCRAMRCCLFEKKRRSEQVVHIFTSLKFMSPLLHFCLVDSYPLYVHRCRSHFFFVIGKHRDDRKQEWWCVDGGKCRTRESRREQQEHKRPQMQGRKEAWSRESKTVGKREPSVSFCVVCICPLFILAFPHSFRSSSFCLSFRRQM